MYSTEVTKDSHEIRIISPGGRVELFGSGLMFGSYHDAQRVAGAMADWFHLGQWMDTALSVLSPDDREDLFRLREGFRADGVTLGHVQVHAAPVCALYDPAGEDREEAGDTPLEPITVFWQPAS